ncbi:hypothetical protein HYT23_06310 [Candidatus Pacearchaeota archaeon]|nr:hypothetical protein [Candidatus Pacearchaeota archaeon]
MNCKWLQVVLFLVIAVFALFVDWATSKWVILVVALVLLGHVLWCKNCNECWGGHSMKSMPKGKR